MKLERFLIVSDAGSTRIMKKRPALAYNEIMMLLHIELPDALFNKPMLRASVTVPDQAAQMDVIHATTQGDFKDAIASATGLEVDVIVKPPEDPE